MAKLTGTCNDCDARMITSSVAELTAWSKAHEALCPGRPETQVTRLMEPGTDVSGGLPIRTA